MTSAWDRKQGSVLRGYSLCPIPSATDLPPRPILPSFKATGAHAREGIIPGRGRAEAQVAGLDANCLLHDIKGPHAQHSRGAGPSPGAGASVSPRWGGDHQATLQEFWEVPKLTSACGIPICSLLGSSKGPAGLSSPEMGQGTVQQGGTWGGVVRRDEKRRH